MKLLYRINIIIGKDWGSIIDWKIDTTWQLYDNTMPHINSKHITEYKAHNIVSYNWDKTDINHRSWNTN